MSYGTSKSNKGRLGGRIPLLPHGFSLIELVIVVVIIGIIAAIAIPRMSRGSKGAADSALAGNLSVLRNAIDMYASEHEGVLPTVADFELQMTGYTQIDGLDPNVAKNPPLRIYGPYLSKLPPLPVGTSSQRGNSKVSNVSGPLIGWIYNETTGNITPNVSAGATDSAGNPYAGY